MKVNMWMEVCLVDNPSNSAARNPIAIAAWCKSSPAPALKVAAVPSQRTKATFSRKQALTGGGGRP
jgi:hypothetical protein